MQVLLGSDGDDAILRIPGEGTILAAGGTVPSSGGGGYAEGCIFIKRDGAAGANIYKNDGTRTSASFVAQPTGAELALLASAVFSAAELAILNALPYTATLTPAAGSSDISLVTIQVKDADGSNIAAVVPLDVWLSDAATGIGLTSTTASGTVAAGASGTDLGILATKKAWRVLTDATGKYILSITDAAKTGFYVGVSVGPRIVVSAQLVTGNYG